MTKYVLHILFVLISFKGISQDLYEHKLDQDKWEGIKERIRYEGQDQIGEEWTYENKEEYKNAIKKRGKGKGNGSGGTGSGTKNDRRYNSKTTPQKSSSTSSNWTPNLVGLSWVGWLLIFLLGAGIVGVIVYAIMNSQTSSHKKINLDDDEFDNVSPAEIPLTELQKKLKESIEKADYRGAIRIYYLFILRDLSQKEWIHWEREKTNMHYLREMNGKSEFDDFNKSISYFEVIWYGKRDIDFDQFKSIQPNFTALLIKLGVE
jgi:hypothetical protein